jgi:hypothetical protein
MDIHNGSFAFLEDIRKQTFYVDTYVNPFFEIYMVIPLFHDMLRT